MLMQVMDNFNIAKSDILACVIDIAANITRTVQLYIHIYWLKKSEFAHLQIRVVLWSRSFSDDDDIYLSFSDGV